MRKYTFEELKKLDVIEITNLCEFYGMSNLSMRTFNLKQKISFIYAEQR